MRRRSSTTLPPDVARDLAALDAALAGEPPAADDGGLGALALALRDDRPRPDAGCAARLDERAAAGFPPRPGPSAPSRRRRAWAGIGVVASGAAAAVLAVALVGGDTGPAVPDGPVAATTTSATDAAGALSAARRAPAPSAGGEAAQSQADAATTTTAAPFAQLATPPAAADVAPRSVERGASLRLATTPKRLDDVVSGVIRATDAAGGYVMSSSVNARSGGGSAVFDLRIPARRLQSALAELSQLAAVRERAQSSADVTSQVGAAAGRVAALRAARRSLLRQIEAAPSEDAKALLRARLRSVDRRLAQAKAVRADLRRRTTYSAVAVEVLTERRPAAVGGGSWTPGDALHDAGRVLAFALGVALVAGAALLPLLVVALAAWPLVRSGRRRRREQALDNA